MRLVYHTHCTPTELDPRGMSPMGDGRSTTLPARLVGEREFQVRTITGVWEDSGELQEGREPGQVSLALRATRTAEADIKRRFAAIEAKDPSPVVRGFASALIDRELGREIGPALGRLMDFAESKTADPTLRMQALVAVAFLLHDHD